MTETKVGKELAERVAKRMMLKCDLMYDHRDYCGTGLTWTNGSFLYGKVYEGYQMHPIKSFNNEQEFVGWLEEQSDKSLDGSDEGDPMFKNNQRITIARLYGFVSSKPTPRIGD
jgi:hypothetical protein